MSDQEIKTGLDQLGKDIDQLAADTRALSDDIAAQQQRNFSHISTGLDRVLERAEARDWTTVANTVRGHPVNNFIGDIQFFNAVTVHDNDLAALREKFTATGHALVNKKLLSEAELNELLDKVNHGRD